MPTGCCPLSWPARSAFSCRAITGLDPITLPFLIIPALGAALLGGFNSFWVTAFAGLGIGMIQALTKTYTAKSWFPREWIPQSGIERALPFFVIIIVLFARGKSLPQRGSVSAGRLPFAPKPKNIFLPSLLLSAGILVIVFAFGYDWRQASINTLVGAALALSLVVITGYVGQISLAQAALAGVAGFAMSKFFQSWLPFPFAPIAGALVAAGFGLLDRPSGATSPWCQPRCRHARRGAGHRGTDLQERQAGGPQWRAGRSTADSQRRRLRARKHQAEGVRNRGVRGCQSAAISMVCRAVPRRCACAGVDGRQRPA